MYTDSQLQAQDEDTRIPEEDADVCEAIGASFNEPIVENPEWDDTEWNEGHVE